MSGFQNYDYESLKALAKELGRSVETLTALGANNDPFYIQPGRRAAAEWFARMLAELGFTSRMHLRAVHYRLLSHTSGTPLGPRGEPYRNTQTCWEALANASRDARYMGLVSVDLFNDHRNNEPIRFLFNHGDPGATLAVSEATAFTPFSAQLYGGLPSPPDFQFEASPHVNQRYHVELWCEKSTMNTILVDLAQRYRLNVITAAGEFSLTHCHQLVQRATASGRLVRILYISDFDPAGVGMPVAVSRKIEFLLRRDNLDLDIQVRQIALTHDQCIEYRLPRTPIKDSERRAEGFEDRFGEGATELDALEGLRPGALHDIIEQEVLRYYDTDLQERVERAVDDFRTDLEHVHAEVLERHDDEYETIRAEHIELINQCNAALKPFREPLRQVGVRFRTLLATIHEELTEAMPDPADIDWPEPEEGDEADDPLFDSTRDYLDQINRYRQHQGRAEGERRPARVAERLNAWRRERSVKINARRRELRQKQKAAP